MNTKFTKIKKFILKAISVNFSIIIAFVFIIIFTQTAQASWLSEASVWLSQTVNQTINSILGNNQTQQSSMTQSQSSSVSAPVTTSSLSTTSSSTQTNTTSNINIYQSPSTAGVSVGNCPVSVPGCNTPINVSDNPQVKIGAFGIGGVLRGYSDAIFDGKVGIGTDNPTQKLDVVGPIKSSSGGIVFPDNTLQTSASYSFGGIYVMENPGPSCRRINPFTGGCSCPSGFSPDFASDGPIHSYFCYKGGSASTLSTTAPSIAFTASPMTTFAGQPTTLSWNSDGLSCTASGDWNGSKALIGSESVNTLAGDSISDKTFNYTLSCTNLIGTSVNSIAVVSKGWKNTTGQGGLGETCNQWLSRTSQAGINGSPAGAINTNGTRLVLPVGNCWYKTNYIYDQGQDTYRIYDPSSYRYSPGYANGGFGMGSYPSLSSYQTDDHIYWIPVSLNQNCSTCYTQTRR